MKMTYQANNRDLMISLAGELDHHAARDAMQRMDRWIEQTMPAKTVLNFDEVTFMDSSGIALVIRGKRRMETLGGVLIVINLPRQAARVLETAGIDKHISLTHKEEKDEDNKLHKL